MNLRVPALLLYLLLIAVPTRAQISGQSTPNPALPPANNAATISLITDRSLIAALNGKWRFHPGDSPAYASPAFDDSQWPLLKSNQSWFKQGYKGLSGYAWYRFRIVLPPGKEPYELELPEILTSYQLFLDGKLIRTIGNMGVNRLYESETLVVPLPSVPGPCPVTVSVALRIWHSSIWSSYYGGGPMDTGHVGTTEQIKLKESFRTDEVRMATNSVLILSLIAFLAGTASLALFLLRRAAREYLWFTLFCLAYLAGGLFTYSFAMARLNIELYETVNEFLGYASGVSLILLLRQLFTLRLTWLYRVAIAATLLDIVQFAPAEWFHLISVGVGNGIGTVLSIIVNCCLIVLVVREAWQKDRNARFLVFPICFQAAVILLNGFLWAARTSGHPFQFSMIRFNIHTPFLITPFNIADLILFLGLFAVLLNRFVRTSREQDRLAAELESARTLQQVLIPEILPTIPGVTIATAYHPAQQVGGDFFQIIPLPNEATIIILGDVSGKGLPAAMTVSVLVGAIRTLAEFTHSPAEVLAGLNRRLIGRGPGFTTCLALHLSPTGLLTFSNAGHLSPYLNGAELDTAPALPLGLDPAATFAEQTLLLSQNDHLTLLTDGVLEAATPTGELYGFARTLAASPQSAASIAAAAQLHGQNDDITVLTLDFA